MRWRGEAVGAADPGALRLHAGGARAVPQDARARPDRVLRPPARARRRRRRRAADGWIERLGLGDRAGDRVESLSLGNQQRVQLGVALAHDPEVLVLDEPFAGLDPVGVDVMSGVLRERAAAGVPVMFSSHQLELVERLCEDVAIINRGRLVASGAVQELRDRGRGGVQHVRVRVEGDGDGRWVAGVPGAELADAGSSGVLVRLDDGGSPDRVLDAARAAGTVTHFSLERPSLADLFREAVASVSRREAVSLVAGREISQRAREKSFLIGTGVSVVIIMLVVTLPSLLGFGGREEYTITVQDPAAAAVAEAAVREADAFDAEVTVKRDADLADVDAALTRDGIRAQEEPDDTLVNILQAANQRVRAAAALRDAGLDDTQAAGVLSPPPLKLTTVEPPRRARTVRASRSSRC